MNGYTFTVTCSCGSTLEHVTSGKVFQGTDTSAIAICPVCGKEWQVLVRLLRVLKSEAATIRQRRHRAKQKASA